DGTRQLTETGDFAATMVDGIHRYLDRALEETARRRVAPTVGSRERFKKIIGVVDERAKPNLEVVVAHGEPIETGGDGVRASWVRWHVFRGVFGEGLLLEPDGEIAANVVALPDADQTPESLVLARRLAQVGCRVIVPVLIDRDCELSGHPNVRWTNQPHREFVYRAAYEMGRHVIGYEVQKVLSLADHFGRAALPFGVIGHGEGGLIAFYAAACDERIDAVGVSGYFKPRDDVWKEPIYRNVWRLLTEFGDAEIGALISPRAVHIEVSAHPAVTGPPAPGNGRGGAAPGVIETPPIEAVRSEFKKMRGMGAFRQVSLTESDGVGNEAVLSAFCSSLGVGASARRSFSSTPSQPSPARGRDVLPSFTELVEDTQFLMREGEYTRRDYWNDADATNIAAWERSTVALRERFSNEVIGELPLSNLPANSRTRQVYDEPLYRGYEVVLDVYEDVFAYGLLLVPKDIAVGEQRPVVVCQHGLEGRPQDLADPTIDNKAYNQYGCRLAERGFVVYAPQNPYIGQDHFRMMQRKANPLGLSLFSFIVQQHQVTLDWLKTLSFVDSVRLAFYGLSYGGKTAMRVPAILTDYCLSICSADYNEWIWKNASTRSPYSYMFTPEWEMFEFDLGNTFNYAEMSWLICPRPFMVERGHHDGVAPDEWVNYEYAKTQRRYDLLGIGDRCEIEFFDGPHTIHGVGTFEFLHRHLNFRHQP
ncbi:MAG: hypothetical protein O3A46_14220, partial [Candidatus Poribacteria bacterium]|nr:hypothetical protein [Candidatus Poribacteria bacterium]